MLLDLRVGNENGLGLISTLRDIDPETRIVVLTGYGSVATAVEAVRRGAVHYLTKPADAEEILAAFERSADGQAGPSAPLQPMTLDRVEWEHINRVLMECGGNVSEAARLLGCIVGPCRESSPNTRPNADGTSTTGRHDPLSNIQHPISTDSHTAFRSRSWAEPGC